jgi:hypothetical protein
MSLGVALLRFVVPQQQLGAAIGWNALAVALESGNRFEISAGRLGPQSYRA